MEENQLSRQEYHNELYIINKDLIKYNQNLLKKINILTTLIILTFTLLSLLNSKNKVDKDMYDFYNSNDKILVNRSQIYNIINYHDLDYIINDSIYETINIKTVENFLSDFSKNKHPYIKDKNDCDDFSYIMYGNFLEWKNLLDNHYPFSFGIIYLKYIEENVKHTMNIFIDNKLKIYCIESQNNSIELCNNFNKIYLRIII